MATFSNSGTMLGLQSEIVSCTIPHKVGALDCCGEVSLVAKSMGAVNCLIWRPSDWKLIGYNIGYVSAIIAIEDDL
ncbi:hypothetical protein Nepgr_000346 [Nepenthes gracilis]|uniref:Uncharacterized protein n=1 Tax=Nepenthes gracilis TaxID=150966 RepID=A0AAD3P6D9_NEPGR|nr:hypothetical protein Nepgr_000346 [Nepenthes gracilis]